MPSVKKSFRTPVSFLIAISPVMVTLLWHIHNQGWPNDDAAQYMKTAYQHYLVFQDGTWLDGLKALYQIRGWRPTLFPALATPFLLLFNGNIPAAAGATLVCCFLLCQIYVYAVARLYLDALRGAIAAAFVGSCPVIVFSSASFFSEIAWLALFSGFVFHLLNSDDFRRPIQASVAGVFLGLAGLIRPAETIALTAIPLMVLTLLAVRQKFLSFRYVMFTAAIVTAAAFMPAALGKLLNDPPVLIFGIPAMIVAYIALTGTGTAKFPGHRGFNLFSFCFIIIHLLWWANSMPELYAWIYEASFGALAQITDVYVKERGFLHFSKEMFLMYLFPQGTFLIALCTVFGLFDSKNFSGRIKILNKLLILCAGALLAGCLMYLITATSDPRRIFAAMSLALLICAVLSLQDGFMQRTRVAMVSLFLALQLTGLFLIADGKPQWLMHPFLVEKGAQGMPRNNPDWHETVIHRLLEAGVPPRSPVAVYTAALFQFHDRIYDPSALSLAALTTGSHLEIIYFWDIGDYDAVIERLQAISVPFLLVDVYEDKENKSPHQPPVQFTKALLAKIKVPYLHPPGLQRIASFIVDGRKQILFRVTPL